MCVFCRRATKALITVDRRNLLTLSQYAIAEINEQGRPIFLQDISPPAGADIRPTVHHAAVRPNRMSAPSVSKHHPSVVSYHCFVGLRNLGNQTIAPDRIWATRLPPPPAGDSRLSAVCGAGDVHAPHRPSVPLRLSRQFSSIPVLASCSK